MISHPYLSFYCTKRVKFAPEEDERLKQLVNRFGACKWNKIAMHIPGRSGRQCRDRYYNYLKPGYINGEWTPQEDEIIKEQFELYGSQWSLIEKMLPKRSANSIKNRWKYYISKQLEIKNQTEEKTRDELISYKESQNEDEINPSFVDVTTSPEENLNNIENPFELDFYTDFTTV